MDKTLRSLLMMNDGHQRCVDNDRFSHERDKRRKMIDECGKLRAYQTLKHDQITNPN